MCFFNNDKPAPAAPVDTSPRIYDTPEMQQNSPQAVSKMYSRDLTVPDPRQTKPQNPNALKNNGLQIM